MFLTQTGFIVFSTSGGVLKWEVKPEETVPLILVTENCQKCSSQQEAIEAFNNGINAWNSVESSFFQFEGKVEAGAVDVEDQINVVGFRSLQKGVLGLARFYVRSGSITEADISIDQDIEVSKLESVLIHEIGHALGLGHDHVDLKSIMSYFRFDSKSGLGVDDIVGVSYLYPVDKDSEVQPTFGCGTITGHHPPFLGQNFINFFILFALTFGWIYISSRHPIWIKQRLAGLRKYKMMTGFFFLGVIMLSCGRGQQTNHGINSLQLENLAGQTQPDAYNLPHVEQTGQNSFVVTFFFPKTWH